SKPDPALFRRALDRAGARPEECLMVGDRLDNDVAPASLLGLTTAWVRWPRRSAKGWRPDDPEGIAYLRSLERSAARRHAAARTIPPTLAIDEIGELDAAIRVWLGH